ncbi:MAG: hypothetical protein U0575_03920 [Phycisphaerales bacterium]
MSDLAKPSASRASASTRSTSRATGESPSGAPPAASDTKPPRMVLLRERIRSVRDESGPGRAALRLASVVAAAAGAVLGVWTLGYLGFRLGVAPTLGATDLLGEPGEGLATGALVVLRAPTAIFRAGLAQPAMLVAGFVAIAIPAAILPLARPGVRGGPRASRTEAGLSAAGAALAMLFAAILVAWSAASMRRGWLGPIPHDTAQTADWANGLDTAAGVDLLAAATATLWAVLVLRLAIPAWLRWLAGATTFFALAVVLIGAGTSNAIAAHVALPRAVVLVAGDASVPAAIDPGSDDGAAAPPASGAELREALLLGYTRGHTLLLEVDDSTPRTELVVAERLPIVGQRSIREMLAPREER